MSYEADLEETIESMSAQLDDDAAVMAQQAAEIAQLREALAPLAAILELWNCDRTKTELDAIPDSQTLDGAGDTNLTLGDLRRAVAVLKGGAR
jgi:hypothetical protein